MSSNQDAIDANLAILDKFRNDSAYSLYWKNWEITQNWMNRCDETYQEYEQNVAWQKAHEDITSLLDSIETADQPNASTTDDIVMEESDQMSEFYRISLEHRQQREAERGRQLEEEARQPKVEYIDAKDIGIHGISSFSVEKKTFGEKAKEHFAEIQEKYGSHAEKIVTLESTMNYKFDEIISKFAPPLWPNIAFRL